MRSNFSCKSENQLALIEFQRVWGNEFSIGMQFYLLVESMIFGPPWKTKKVLRGDKTIFHDGKNL